MKRWHFILLISMLGFSCTLFREEPPPSIDDPRIIGKANERIQQYISIKVNSCNNGILNNADLHVDSTITNIISKFLTDTVYFPSRPDRPVPPEKLVPDSTLNPVPLFRDTLPVHLKWKKDTLLLAPDSVPLPYIPGIGNNNS